MRVFEHVGRAWSQAGSNIVRFPCGVRDRGGTEVGSRVAVRAWRSNGAGIHAGYVQVFEHVGHFGRLFVSSAVLSGAPSVVAPNRLCRGGRWRRGRGGVQCLQEDGCGRRDNGDDDDGGSKDAPVLSLSGRGRRYWRRCRRGRSRASQRRRQGEVRGLRSGRFGPRPRYSPLGGKLQCTRQRRRR